MNNFNHYYDSETTRQVISVIVLNEHNVLSRIVGLFSARGYNIDSLTVAPITDSQYSRMTIVTTGDKRIIDQIVKQLNKLHKKPAPVVSNKTCPFCVTKIDLKATRCPHCTSELESWNQPERKRRFEK